MHRDQKVTPLRNRNSGSPDAPPPPPEPGDDQGDDDDEDDEDVFDPTAMDPDTFWSYWHAWIDSHPSRAGWAQIELSRRMPEFTEWLKSEWEKKRRLDALQDIRERA